MFSLEKFDEGADYVIFDDYDASKFASYKCWFSAQEEFTLTDKYARKRTVKWGKPMIWLSNDDPRDNLVFDQNWLRANSIIVHLEDKLYGEPAEAEEVPLSGWSLSPPPRMRVVMPIPRRATPNHVAYLEDFVGRGAYALPREAYRGAIGELNNDIIVESD
jgi:hypothetical protein